MCLFHQGFCAKLDAPSRAALHLERASLFAPDNPLIWFWLGWVRTIAYDRRAAIAAYHHALLLDPDNMEYRKGLDRAQAMSIFSIIFGKLALWLYLSANALAWIIFGIAALLAVLMAGALTKLIMAITPLSALAAIYVVVLALAFVAGIFKGLFLRGFYQFLGIFGFDPRQKQ